MRILIDECVDPRVRLLLGDHKVATVHEQRWDELEDGRILAVASYKKDVLAAIENVRPGEAIHVRTPPF